MKHGREMHKEVEYNPKLPSKKISSPDGFHGEFYQIFKELLTNSLYILNEKNLGEVKILPRLFLWTHVTLTPKPGKDVTKMNKQNKQTSRHTLQKP